MALAAIARVSMVASERPDIGALAALDHEICVVPVGPADELQLLDPDPPRLQFHDFAGPGEIIGAPPVDFQGGEDRRHLLDLSKEARQGRVDRGIRRPHITSCRHLALGILGRAGFAETQGEPVFLAGVHDERHRLGRLAERDRKNSARQRIERAAMSRLLGAEQTPYATDRRRRAKTDRLVEHDPAVDLVALFSSRHPTDQRACCPSFETRPAGRSSG